MLGIGGTLRLYAMPAALAILAGSALREAFSSFPAPISAVHMSTPERSSP
jgi:hypothetical protein